MEYGEVIPGRAFERSWMQLYEYTWGNNEKRQTLKGKICIVKARLALNSCVVEFENGQQEVVSRNALRKVEE